MEKSLFKGEAFAIVAAVLWGYKLSGGKGNSKCSHGIGVYVNSFYICTCFANFLYQPNG